MEKQRHSPMTLTTAAIIFLAMYELFLLGVIAILTWLAHAIWF